MTDTPKLRVAAAPVCCNEEVQLYTSIRGPLGLQCVRCGQRYIQESATPVRWRPALWWYDAPEAEDTRGWLTRWIDIATDWLP